MKAKVIEAACIGCGACEATISDVFELNENGIAFAKNENITDENKNEVIEAAESCPVEAIEIEEEKND